MTNIVGVQEKIDKGKPLRPLFSCKFECLDIYSGAVIQGSIDSDLLEMELGEFQRYPTELCPKCENVKRNLWATAMLPDP